MMMMSSSNTTAPITMNSHSQLPCLGGLHTGAIVTSTGSWSSLSILRISLWTLPSHDSPSPVLGSKPGNVR